MLLKLKHKYTCRCFLSLRLCRFVDFWSTSLSAIDRSTDCVCVFEIYTYFYVVGKNFCNLQIFAIYGPGSKDAWKCRKGSPLFFMNRKSVFLISSNLSPKLVSFRSWPTRPLTYLHVCPCQPFGNFSPISVLTFSQIFSGPTARFSSASSLDISFCIDRGAGTVASGRLILNGGLAIRWNRGWRNGGWFNRDRLDNFSIILILVEVFTISNSTCPSVGMHFFAAIEINQSSLWVAIEFDGGFARVISLGEYLQINWTFLCWHSFGGFRSLGSFNCRERRHSRIPSSPDWCRC